MTTDDRAAKKAEELLPWETFSCETADEETWQQLAYGIAAELREAYAEIDKITHDLDQSNKMRLEHLKSNESLRAELAKVKP